MSEKTENRLVEIVKTDKKLSDEMRQEFLILARYYAEDFAKNLFKSSIDLDEETSYGLDTWTAFLNYPAIKKHIDMYVDETISKNANISLAMGEGVRDAIAVKERMDKKSNAPSNDKFIIFRMPEKEAGKYEYSGNIE